MRCREPDLRQNSISSIWYKTESRSCGIFWEASTLRTQRLARIMKYLTSEKRVQAIGKYYSPEGYYEYSRSLPFLGTITCDFDSLVAGSWQEIIFTYEIGSSGLADGASIKGAFKFYSDWALFQTSDSARENYLSAEYEAAALLPGQTSPTIQRLNVRFDQKGHERPFQKAVIVDVVDGYLNPGDKIIIRLGDQRFGGKGTRVQTFVESEFCWRFFIDPVGTSRFARIRPDIRFSIVPGPPSRLEIVTPRLLQPDVPFAISIHPEDIWGNIVKDLSGFHIHACVCGKDGVIQNIESAVPDRGWANAKLQLPGLAQSERYTVEAELRDPAGDVVLTTSVPLTVSKRLFVPKVLFGDLHVHSDDTVGTENSTYNFTYGRDIAGLDVLGYTANDFQITKTRWDATVRIIQSMNEPGSFVIYPGTEWCGNSAAGGDHNVVFLSDPETHPPEFPVDRCGNVARSFEWSEDGPKDLVPGAWPLDEVYATYAHDARNVLMIPHVGGRRCNLSWHHPELERLIEVGSAWGHFEWQIRDAVERGWKMGVCANSDEHRGRCGGGVPGTAVFGTRGGLTGILASSLDRETVAQALRARHTFATTGRRLVAILKTTDGHVQGDEIAFQVPGKLVLEYHLLGTAGFSSVSAYDASGEIYHRNLFHESAKPLSVLRVTWGGARLYDRYREAVWNGTIVLDAADVDVASVQPFGGFELNPEDTVIEYSPKAFGFSSRTSGDMDGINILFSDSKLPETVTVSGTLGGYIKVGDPLAGHQHKAQPTFALIAGAEEIIRPGGKCIEIAGGAELFVRVEAVPDEALPTEVEDTIEVGISLGEKKAVYVVGREWSGDKVVTSPVFVRFEER
ncbi:polymerase histidinol phosphatase-like [Teratosphaeria destructans]|uniref:Polymerase histidinol phosphatase-like n=1 Tax=Teratosphaeria destructans TaxID=418781 RepID=A0A9W7SYZ0_9PEZI|nr:polymerase histidinol phosphatase-like [Teratosphaeria destructans]